MRLICAKFVTGNRPGTIGRRMPSGVAAVAEAEEVVVVVEQLRDDHVGPGVDLALEVREIGIGAGRFLMRFRVAGDGDAELRKLAVNERRPARWRSGIRLSTGLNAVSPLGGSPRRATTLATPDAVGRSQVLAKLIDRAADAGEMRRHRQLKLAMNAGDDFERRLLRRAAGAVRARDEARLKLDQPRDVLK